MEKEECSSCKKGLQLKHYGMILLSTYMLIATGVGTVSIVKYIINLF
jgi:hypothetical protein